MMPIHFRAQVFVKKHSEIGDVPGGTPVQQLKKMNTVMQESIQIEQDVLVPNAGGGSIYVYMHDGQWCQIKAAEYVRLGYWVMCCWAM
jgi:hypothetical protein